jgi:UDP-N-acetylglucosamine diphosphorylase/glucosamine-1-phosphate N-acetyltransferase
MTLRTILFDDHLRSNFFPLTLSRGSMELICGAGSLRDRVARLLVEAPGVWVPDYLADVTEAMAVNQLLQGPTLLLNGRGRWKRIPDAGGPEGWVGVLPGSDAIACVYTGEHWDHDALYPAALLDPTTAARLRRQFPIRDVSSCVELFAWPWELLHAHPAALASDASDWFRGAPKRPMPEAPGVHFLNPDRIEIGAGTRIKPCVVIDAESGPIFIGRDVTILPFVSIQGPAYIGDGALLQAGAVVRAGSYIGPVCKVGGEIEGSILQGYSNKQHDGFLGHSYVGSWVNIAADCINSDLKNTYGTIRMPMGGIEVETGHQFMGVLIGDHAKVGINCSIPTGSVIGFNSSVFAAVAPRSTGSFRWFEEGREENYDFERALVVAERVMRRRGRTVGPAERRMFEHIHALTTPAVPAMEASVG